jgi:hypothetical protein
VRVQLIVERTPGSAFQDSFNVSFVYVHLQSGQIVHNVSKNSFCGSFQNRIFVSLWVARLTGTLFAADPESRDSRAFGLGDATLTMRIH